jgi:hypothetical protein
MEEMKKKLMKLAQDAFERATTMQPGERLEVYLDNGTPKMSERMKEDEEMVYGPVKVLCYRIEGHNHLEDEIVSWIDMARIIPQPADDEPLPEPTAIETAIRDIIGELAKQKQVNRDAISSYEVFANLPMDFLGEIEQKIIAFWWDGAEVENGKMLAEVQIDEALAQLK